MQMKGYKAPDLSPRQNTERILTMGLRNLADSDSA